MHVLFVHQNFPAQFGHIAAHLVEKMKWKCSFVSETPGGFVAGIEKIQYQTTGGATPASHFCARTFENNIWNCDGVYQALRARPDVKPDLIVGHSGFGSTLFLRELYPDVPVFNFFEYYYHPHDPQSDMEFRSDLKWELDDYKFLRSRCRNAMILLDLQNCQLGYCPTEFQRSRFPSEYLPKLRTVFDGIDRSVYHGHEEELRPAVEFRKEGRTVAGVHIPANTKVVTYCSRGFESMRGFDVFMKAAKKVCDQRDDVIFLVIGTDRIAYGGDSNHTSGKSFKQWVLDQDNYDLDRIRFLGRISPLSLAQLLAATDLHIYLTVPFVLSWSMMNAMSAGAVVLGSRTPPVEEMIIDGENGLLANFFDPDEFAAKTNQVLNDIAGHRDLGRAAEQLIVEKYSMDIVLPEMVKLYEEAVATTTGREPSRNQVPAAVRQVLRGNQNSTGKNAVSFAGNAAGAAMGGTGLTPTPKTNPPGGRSPFFG